MASPLPGCPPRTDATSQLLAALGLLLGFLPLFGWLNWIFVLPPAVLGLIFGAMSRDRGAITLSAVVAVLGALRLMLGGGVI